ncbi:thermonuclease family protein [Mesorhizobium camelthorni]|uniref:Thermonuclease family protein n=1 Tax=Allomesorhizobium camelthorni TaxID=475069 RepID=A0A6G4W7R1_9HYPH|nr:thermonuclease family protein [Mesorhizobium camelthorni]
MKCLPKLGAAVWLVAVSASASAAEVKGIAKVIDGDTIRIGGTTIRLHGIDAPEAGQKCVTASGKSWDCGDAAMDGLGDLIAGHITCVGTEYDGYNRLLAVCRSSEGIEINRTLVKDGHAWAFRKYSFDYANEEAEARASRLRIWQAVTQTPWDYRADKWRVAEQTSPNGCPIKGNISNNGHIYHAPWSPWYSRTKLSLEKGERWFCSEREALDAGWRAPAWR